MFSQSVWISAGFTHEQVSCVLCEVSLPLWWTRGFPFCHRLRFCARSLFIRHPYRFWKQGSFLRVTISGYFPLSSSWRHVEAYPSTKFPLWVFHSHFTGFLFYTISTVNEDTMSGMIRLAFPMSSMRISNNDYYFLFWYRGWTWSPSMVGNITGVVWGDVCAVQLTDWKS